MSDANVSVSGGSLNTDNFVRTPLSAISLVLSNTLKTTVGSVCSDSIYRLSYNHPAEQLPGLSCKPCRPPCGMGWHVRGRVWGMIVCSAALAIRICYKIL